MDEKEDKAIYKVVVNHEEQYSIWFADREPPLGWREVGKTGPKAECHIKEVWTDMRPLSLRKKMEETARKGNGLGESMFINSAQTRHTVKCHCQSRAPSMDDPWVHSFAGCARYREAWHRDSRCSHPSENSKRRSQVARNYNPKIYSGKSYPLPCY